MHVWVIEYRSPRGRWLATWDHTRTRSAARELLAHIREMQPGVVYRVRKYVRV